MVFRRLNTDYFGQENGPYRLKILAWSSNSSICLQILIPLPKNLQEIRFPNVGFAVSLLKMSILYLLLKLKRCLFQSLVCKKNCTYYILP